MSGMHERNATPSKFLCRHSIIEAQRKPLIAWFQQFIGNFMQSIKYEVLFRGSGRRISFFLLAILAII
jgi:hypothetical protein